MPPSVLVVQRILPPYRVPFFRRLATSPSLRLRVAYGSSSKVSSLQSVKSPPGIGTVQLHNTYLNVNRREVAVYQNRLLGLLRSGGHGVVISEFDLRIISNVLACLYARQAKMRFIWWGHGMSPRSGRASILLRRGLAHLADAIIFYDSEQARRFRSLGIPQRKLFVAPNSIDTEAIEGFVQEGSLNERNRVLFIGRLIPEKKVDLLIRGFARAYPELEPETVLSIIGDGPELTRLKRLTSRLAIARHVDFIGGVYREDLLAPLFNSAWVSVSPGYVGLSAIHSLAYGIPMLVARGEPHSPEVAALREGVNAQFFHSNDPEELSQRLVCLAKDKERLTRMREAARRTIKDQFNISHMVEAFERAVDYVRSL